jgi:hypothetical protein
LTFSDAQRVRTGNGTAAREPDPWTVTSQHHKSTGPTAQPDPERTAGLTRDGLILATPFQTAHVTSRLDAVLEATRPFRDAPVIRDLDDYSQTWRADRRALPAPGAA